MSTTASTSTPTPTAAPVAAPAPAPAAASSSTPAPAAAAPAPAPAAAAAAAVVSTPAPPAGTSTSSSSSAPAAAAAGVNVGAPAAYASASLYVGDLSPEVSEPMLFDIFNVVGSVASVRVCRDAATRRSLGYAYVNFHNMNDAERALETMNFKPIRNRICRIMWSHRDPSLRRSGVGNIFVNHLAKTIDHKSLYDTFSIFGNILSCKVAMDEKGESKGYGFVHYESESSAKAAIAKVDGMVIAGQQVNVANFKTKKERQQESKWTVVFVRNLPVSITEAEVRELFKANQGTIKSVFIKVQSQHNKANVFIDYSDPNEAVACLDRMNNVEYAGEKLFVTRFQKRAERERENREKSERNAQEMAKKSKGLNLYIKNFTDIVDDARLAAEFGKYGVITSAKVMKDQNTQKSRCFGFVCFSKAEEANKAFTEMNGIIMDSKPLYVAYAQSKAERQALFAASQRAKAMSFHGAAYPAAMASAQGMGMGMGMGVGTGAGAGMGVTGAGAAAGAGAAMGAGMGMGGGMGAGMGVGVGAGMVPSGPSVSMGMSPHMGFHPNPMMLNGRTGGLSHQPPFIYGQPLAMGMSRFPPTQMMMNGRIPANMAYALTPAANQRFAMNAQANMQQNNAARQQRGTTTRPRMQQGNVNVNVNAKNMNMPTPYANVVAGQAQAAQTQTPSQSQSQQSQVRYSDNVRNRQGAGAGSAPVSNPPASASASASAPSDMMMQPLPDIKALAAAPPDMAKQMIGERLFPLIQLEQPTLAGKITGMLLEMDNHELIHLLEDSAALKEKIGEAMQVLQEPAQEAAQDNGQAQAQEQQ